MGDWKHLSYASSLCGNCTEVCAVKINLHELLLANRQEAIVSGYGTMSEKMAWKIWKQASLKRSWMNAGNSMIKNSVVNKLFGGWTRGRSNLKFQKKTFNELWKEKHAQ